MQAAPDEICQFKHPRQASARRGLLAAAGQGDGPIERIRCASPRAGKRGRNVRAALPRAGASHGTGIKLELALRTVLVTRSGGREGSLAVSTCPKTCGCRNGWCPGRQAGQLASSSPRQNFIGPNHRESKPGRIIEHSMPRAKTISGRLGNFMSLGLTSIMLKRAKCFVTELHRVFEDPMRRRG